LLFARKAIALCSDESGQEPTGTKSKQDPAPLAVRFGSTRCLAAAAIVITYLQRAFSDASQAWPVPCCERDLAAGPGEATEPVHWRAAERRLGRPRTVSWARFS